MHYYKQNLCMYQNFTQKLQPNIYALPCEYTTLQ